MGNRVEYFIEGIIALFFLVIFGTMILPILQQVTGQNMLIFYISLIMIGIGIGFSTLRLFAGGFR
ncbi:hypothetical protein KAR52_02195 [Candidatus Pacearchaeota archaeon]|nr:hypothetical protein [Candidatus Pacearchaeota archaeon]